jgi:DNA (cytosine-5)-methyltransferase 1
MRLLDLFCCAGGAGMGYHVAGFDVTGVDINPQPNYPFDFMQADVLTLDVGFLRLFDAIHASPPCQGYSSMRHVPNTVGAPLLIEEVRRLLQKADRPFIIENVEQAGWAMGDPIVLCGSMFDLGTEGHELRRHRLFESNIKISAPGPCRHSAQPVVGVYGGHARRRSAVHGGRKTKDTWKHGHKHAMQDAMGMRWGTCTEISEAIPPSYTEHLGRQLMEACK